MMTQHPVKKTAACTGSRKEDVASSEIPLLPEKYEEAIAELEALVAQMESGELDLEASLVAYRHGAALVTHCQQQLAAVEEQVQVLEDGMLKPFSIDEIENE